MHYKLLVADLTDANQLILFTSIIELVMEWNLGFSYFLSVYNRTTHSVKTVQ